MPLWLVIPDMAFHTCDKERCVVYMLSHVQGFFSYFFFRDIRCGIDQLFKQGAQNAQLCKVWFLMFIMHQANG